MLELPVYNDRILAPLSPYGGKGVKRIDRGQRAAVGLLEICACKIMTSICEISGPGTRALASLKMVANSGGDSR